MEPSTRRSGIGGIGTEGRVRRDVFSSLLGRPVDCSGCTVSGVILLDWSVPSSTQIGLLLG